MFLIIYKNEGEAKDRMTSFAENQKAVILSMSV
jgi:hypothetical protein